MADNPFSLIFTILKPVWRHFWQWGWVIGPVAFAPLLLSSWLYYIRVGFIRKMKWVVLEFRLPPDVEKTPLAMEQVLAILHSTLFPGSWWKRHVEGRVQEWFSLEMTSFEGELHFYIRTIEHFRNMVEAAIYSQYPQAEIFEVEDYTASVPMVIPNETHNLFGSEFKLAREDGYPIRTYKDFEFKTEGSREGSNISIVDPLAGIVETMTKLSRGEQVWIQFGIRPTGDGWKKVSQDLVMKLVGRPKKETPQGSYVLALLKKELTDYASGLAQAPFKTPEYEPFEFGSASRGDKPHSLMQYLSPGEREVLEAVERNISKVGFETVIRVVYIAAKETYNIPTFFQVTSGFNQFNTQNLNAIKRDGATITAAKFPFKKIKEAQKKKWLLFKYRMRHRPKSMFVLNIEELASLFHFPGRVVTAPTLPRVQAKKGEPPVGLPTY